jgi:hypothetical protein
MTGAIELPSGTVAQRPTATTGMVRLNTDANEFEGYANGAWQSIGGGLNELPQKNYLKAYATAALSPNPVGVAATGTISTTAGQFYGDTVSGASSMFHQTPSPLRGSSCYLSGVSSASTAGTTFVQCPAFALEGSDLGKPVVVSFDINSSITDGEWDVVVVRYNSSGVYQELIPVAGNASSASATPSAKLPTGTTTFKGFFVSASTATDLYAVRFRRLVGSQQIRLDTLFVGPQSLATVNARTDLRSYTPTGSATTNTTYAGVYSTNGDVIDYLDVTLTFSGAPNAFTSLLVGLPAGMTIDTTKLASASGLSSRRFAGRGTLFSNGSPNRNTLNVYVDPAQSTTQLVVEVESMSAATDLFLNRNNAVTSTVPSTLASGDVIRIEAFGIPIANRSSNITAADRAVEEYAWNSSTSTTAGDTTSFGYGPRGAVIQAITAPLRRRVRFQTPIQSTDRIVVEVSTDTAGLNWVELGTGVSDNATFRISQFQRQNAVQYGIGNITVVNSTDVDVGFGQYACEASSGGFAAAGEAWGTAGGARYYRVRKVSGGAVVGYPVGARNVYGDTSGTPVPTGMLAQEQLSSVTALSSVGTTGTYFDATTVTLTAGTYDVTGTFALYRNGATFAFLKNELAVLTAAGNSITGATETVNHVVNTDGSLSASFTSHTFYMPTVRVYCDGTSITVNGTTTAGTTLRLKSLVHSYSAATPQYRASLRAVRIG